VNLAFDSLKITFASYENITLFSDGKSTGQIIFLNIPPYLFEKREVYTNSKRNLRQKM